MAELAAGAVSSLLVVIRSEALLLRGVRDDVQFIKEEMESMKSFLAHLARWAPPGGEHDEQVRTWMNQVRLLAQDCNNCIDLYLYRRNPDIHRARGGLRRYLWWATWLLHKLVAQHRAAEQLRQLKERARDVGERRLRYGVEVPAKSGEGQSPPTTGLARAAAAARTATPGGYAAGDDDDQLVEALAPGGHSGRRAFTEPRTLGDYVKEKLCEWADGIPVNAGKTLSMVIVSPYTDEDLVAPYTVQNLLTLVKELLVVPSVVLPIAYHRMVLVDIPVVHPDFAPLRPTEVLFYILRELKHAKSGKVEEKCLDPWEDYMRRFQIYSEKKRAIALLKIKENIEEMKIDEKLDKIKHDIQGRLSRGDGLLLKGDKMDGEFDQLDLGVLLQLLLQAADQGKNKDMHGLPVWYNNNIIVKKLKEHMETEQKDEKLEEEEAAKHMEEGGEVACKHMEEGKGEITIHDMDEEHRQEEAKHMEEGDGGGETESQRTTWIHLDEAQYAHILRKLFPKSSSGGSKPLQTRDKSSDKQATKTRTTTLGEDQIKQMIHDAKEDILRELQEGKYDKSKETSESGGAPDQNPEAVEKFGQMMDTIKKEFKEQLKIKGLMDEIKRNLNYLPHLNNYEGPLFVLKVDELMDVSTWEDTRNALSLLNSSADLMMVTPTKDIQLAKEYCYPEREPIDYSLAGLYHDTLLELTSQQKNEDNYNPQIFHDILYECEPHEFCMKIFTHALYVNPRRSNEELFKLHSTLRALPKSFNNIAKVMFKFSYNDLPKEYKSCLLYLAIFSPGHKIRRSTLTGRWIAEGLTSKEDWLSSVRQANRCFDELVDRCLVDPADIGATGNVNSCIVREPVHGFITTIARKQHMVETRLSHHLARHFSIFNDLQLRSSDRIDKFFQGLSNSSRVSLLKVLDLEGCQCFGGKNRRYLKDICSKMLLLKYLSLRKTDITQLPSEINNLRELEVLDIRQTKVPPHATANILMLKLKRLLAGHTDLNASKIDSSGRIPSRIDKMVNMEVLSNVKAKHSHDLKDIGKLWQLRKLGVVIDDKDSHLRNLLETISDLHECLRSLSITTTCEGTPPSAELPDYIVSLLENQPKILESLSIMGTTQKGRLLPLFIKGNENKLAKVTLTSTQLNQGDLEVLAMLPNLRCVRLQHIACTGPMLNFEAVEFSWLKYLLVVDCSAITKIVFTSGSAPCLEKIVWSSSTSLSGIDELPRLKELEFIGSQIPDEVREAIEEHENKPSLILNGPETEE